MGNKDNWSCGTVGSRPGIGELFQQLSGMGKHVIL